MYQKNIEINLNYNDYMDKATKIVEAASKFESEIFIEREGKLYNAKSIVGVLSIGAETGKNLTVMADGKDKLEAVNKIVELIRD